MSSMTQYVPNTYVEPLMARTQQWEFQKDFDSEEEQLGSREDELKRVLMDNG